MSPRADPGPAPRSPVGGGTGLWGQQSGLLSKIGLAGRVCLVEKPTPYFSQHPGLIRALTKALSLAAPFPHLQTRQDN